MDQFILHWGTKVANSAHRRVKKSVYEGIRKDPVSDQYTLLSVECIYCVDIFKAAVNMIVPLIDDTDLDRTGSNIFIILNTEQTICQHHKILIVTF
ncbi:hypothetical protein FPZ43_18415 [Mucilaginibacter pallidiroseus]|uniref:Uncharacterized protein n=1 Tax=Mucilaginibacter pallidiroseus TaxID=2599295 RepID=A0A563U0K9_9SPHI|nr:hypothetical protein [Mucilaginibacter pallidiroseus]TWR24401.1 hypothetical protein FPZ43_18415 [Mucilaginibacter pallidiroseus]